uniref:OTU domain-containing protein n=1 Tax=Calcidiscus leptoporus TaxID=127549 RepID=A0A7S0IXW2_9EUKA|mmetsp:Transcript_2870/g.6500  ORF Transcript_2870/g.6500 Transcript_2870/m.6500 type:complete len:339 (+) Transcript_2870:29-1045(+)
MQPAARERERSAPAAREGTLDMLMSRSSAVRARLMNDAKVSIDYIEACGDCFYMAIEAALSEHDGWHPHYAVAQQRLLVAQQMTEETFQLYTLLHTQRAEGFHFMKGVDSLEALRRRVKLRGQKVGAHKCVWADGFAMETIANCFRVLLLVIDERSAQKFTRISPAAKGGEREGGEGVLDAEQNTVLLHASTREHMNLIRYDGKKLPQLGDLPVQLRQLWGIRGVRGGAAAPLDGGVASRGASSAGDGRGGGGRSSRRALMQGGRRAARGGGGGAISRKRTAAAAAAAAAALCAGGTREERARRRYLLRELAHEMHAHERDSVELGGAAGGSAAAELT